MSVFVGFWMWFQLRIRQEKIILGGLVVYANVRGLMDGLVSRCKEGYRIC